MNDQERQRFRHTVAERAPAMIGFAYLLTGDQRAAERALRAAVSRVASRWRQVDSLAVEGQIVKSMCRRELGWRRRLRHAIGRREARLWAAGPTPDSTRAHLVGSTSEAAPRVASDRRGAMRRALLALRPADRAVMALRHHELLNDEETAWVLGCSVGTVRSRAERARARLHELLANISMADRDASDARTGPRRSA